MLISCKSFFFNETFNSLYMIDCPISASPCSGVINYTDIGKITAPPQELQVHKDSLYSFVHISML